MGQASTIHSSSDSFLERQQQQQQQKVPFATQHNTMTFLSSMKNYFIGSNDDPLPHIQQQQQHGHRENQQEVIIQNGGEDDNKLQVSKTENAAQVNSENPKPPESFSRDTTDLSSRKGSVLSQDTRSKPDRRTRKDHHHLPTTTKTCLNCVTAAKENAKLKSQVEVGRQDVVKVNKHSEELEGRIQRLVGEKGDLLTSANNERERTGREQMEAKKQIRDLQGRNQKLEEELNILKGTLRGVQDKHLHTVKLLEERTSDLKGAQTFLTTVDRYAGAEIMKMVEALNAEIFQGAALVSDLLGDGNDASFEVVDEGRRNYAQLTRGQKDYLTKMIGPKLTEHLSTKSKQLQVDPFPLQLAVQTILTKWCVYMVGSFYQGPAGSDLKEIYRRIWESEPQAVAGRWRAMMTKQVKHMDSTAEKGALPVIDILFNLLCLCGSPRANVASQQTGLRLHQVVSTILNMWMQLRTAIHEGVTATEMEVFCANANETYQGSVMNDIYADAEDDVQQQPDLGKETTGHILCTVGMGLKRSVNRRNGDGMMSLQSDIILKATVAFPSVLFDSA